MRSESVSSLPRQPAAAPVADRQVENELSRVFQSDTFENALVPDGVAERPQDHAVNNNNWFLPWNFHWTFNHTTELFPHTPVANAPGKVRRLESAPRALGDVQFRGRDGRMKTLQSLIDNNGTDGFMVLQHGKVLHESVKADVSPTQNHWTLSLCRTFPALIAGKLAEQGKLKMDQPVEEVIPELAKTGFKGVTLRQLLDMRSGVTSTNILAIMYADGFFPTYGVLPKAHGIHDLILSRTSRQKPHGGKFQYRCLDSEILGWLCERASGKRLPDLIADMVWKPMGAEKPAQFLLDGADTPAYEAGLCANMRDLARFGLVLAEDGKPNTPQILPRGWMDDTRTGDADTRQAFGGKFFGIEAPNGMYRNHMWVLDADKGITLCYGAFGQMVYLDPARDLVCVLTSSWGRPQDPLCADWLAAFEALGERLGA